MHKRKPIQGCVSESKHGHLLYGDGWSMVVSDHHLEPKMSIVVTKLGGNLVSLIPFSSLSSNSFGYENLERTKLNASWMYDRII